MGAIACYLILVAELTLAWFAFGYRRRAAAVLCSLLTFPTAGLCAYLYRDMLVSSGKPTFMLGWSFQPFVPASLGIFLLLSAVCILLCITKAAANH